MTALRVLHVDDEPDIREIVQISLNLDPGMETRSCASGPDALEAIKAWTPDIVLLDVMMPIMDGLTATQQIRQNPDWKKLPIIILTAKAMPDDQERCLAAGASDYMAKPLDVEKLLSLIRVWMPSN